MSETEETVAVEHAEKMRMRTLRAAAVNASMVEFLKEHQEEIIRRARAKLVAEGIEFSDEAPPEGAK